MKNLFISDLHLHPQRPGAIRLFEDFVHSRARHADRLFILGDLFEYWLGDDAAEHSGYQVVAEILATLSRQQTRVFFMHGNRDFLVGKEYLSTFGGEMLPDPQVFKLDGLAVLLMHGDSLCTDDVAHQAFRTRTRNQAWQQEILSKSIQQREDFARQLRMDSEAGKQIKTESIMDVAAETVHTVMQASSVRLLIHGHTHRPAIHTFMLADKPAYRMVLGDWYDKGSYLLQEGNIFQLMSWPDETVIASLVV